MLYVQTPSKWNRSSKHWQTGKNCDLAEAGLPAKLEAVQVQKQFYKYVGMESTLRPMILYQVIPSLYSIYSGPLGTLMNETTSGKESDFVQLEELTQATNWTRLYKSFGSEYL